MFLKHQDETLSRRCQYYYTFAARDKVKPGFATNNEIYLESVSSLSQDIKRKLI